MTQKKSISIKALPAALLTEALVSTGNGYFGSLWMDLTNFMPAVILSAFTEVWITPINQAMSYTPWCLGPLWWGWFHHTVQAFTFLPLNSWPELTTSQNVKESYNFKLCPRQDLIPSKSPPFHAHPSTYSKILNTSNPIKQNRNI